MNKDHKTVERLVRNTFKTHAKLCLRISTTKISLPGSCLGDKSHKAHDPWGKTGQPDRHLKELDLLVRQKVHVLSYIQEVSVCLYYVCMSLSQNVCLYVLMTYVTIYQCV